MKWKNSSTDKLVPEYVREQEANASVQQRLNEAEHRHELESVGDGRIPKRLVALGAGGIVLALVVLKIVLG